MKMKWMILGTIILLILGVGCGQEDVSNGNDNELPFAVEGDLPASPAALEWITDAATDLAERESVNLSEITFVQFELPVWPDTSYGCPDPETAYIFTEKEGYKIQLRFDETDFFYHGGEDIEQFLCEN